MREHCGSSLNFEKPRVWIQRSAVIACQNIGHACVSAHATYRCILCLYVMLRISVPHPAQPPSHAPRRHTGAPMHRTAEDEEDVILRKLCRTSSSFVEASLWRTRLLKSLGCVVSSIQGRDGRSPLIIANIAFDACTRFEPESLRGFRAGGRGVANAAAGLICLPSVFVVGTRFGSPRVLALPFPCFVLVIVAVIHVSMSHLPLAECLCQEIWAHQPNSPNVE